ncbi:hypothetical protein BDV41DRAFT_531366 [Aspergillus transmontanensis]|uniref:Uncharacterized protein n=1 Tax=Aspergillus transmontanensis TaxID=1034304 RepID=A0A5N6W3W1_9EURO|nr:hypothetical protein BDV41DRAFT_531366 [Aspergillus transmontanensis]
MDYSYFGRALRRAFWINHWAVFCPLISSFISQIRNSEHSELRKEVVYCSMSERLLLLDKIATWLIFICLLFPVPDCGTFFPLTLIGTIEFSLPL